MDPELFSLGGKVAVVTGASRGIGGALASALAHAGAAVALLGRDTQALSATQAALAAQGHAVMHVTADVGVNSSIATPSRTAGPTPHAPGIATASGGPNDIGRP